MPLFWKLGQGSEPSRVHALGGRVLLYPHFHSGASSCSLPCQVSLWLKFSGYVSQKTNLSPVVEAEREVIQLHRMRGGWFFLLHKKNLPTSPLIFNLIPLTPSPVAAEELPSPEPSQAFGGRARSTCSLLNTASLGKVLQFIFFSFSPTMWYLVLHKCFLDFLKEYILFL